MNSEHFDFARLNHLCEESRKFCAAFRDIIPLNVPKKEELNPGRFSDLSCGEIIRRLQQITENLKNGYESSPTSESVPSLQDEVVQLEESSPVHPAESIEHLDEKEELEEIVVAEIVSNEIVPISFVSDSSQDDNAPPETSDPSSIIEEIEHIDFIIGDAIFEGVTHHRKQLETFIVITQVRSSIKKSSCPSRWFTRIFYATKDGISCHFHSFQDRLHKIRGRIFSRKEGMMRKWVHNGRLVIFNLLFMKPKRQGPNSINYL